MKVHLIFFSPAGTTKRTVRNIAKGMKGVEILEYDMLKKTNREKIYNFSEDDLVILGMMTATKLFGVPKEIIGALKGNDTPFVGVVMYGNHYYGSALILMKKAMEKRGFKMVAGGAFIGQNSTLTSIASGRPDEKDRALQLKFGEDIYNKIVVEKDVNFYSNLKMDWPKGPSKILFLKSALIAAMPGIGIALTPSINQFSVTDVCIRCGKCIHHCPVEAITLNDKIEFDRRKCIGCFGCVNACPTKAIQYKNPIILKMMAYTKEDADVRREPEMFF